MDKKFFLSAMLIMALVFGMTVVGCDNGTISSDTWSNITSLNQMNGTWKASYSQNNRPIKDVMEEQGYLGSLKCRPYMGI